jgi:hypothetical protein
MWPIRFDLIWQCHPSSSDSGDYGPQHPPLSLVSRWISTVQSCNVKQARAPLLPNIQLLLFAPNQTGLSPLEVHNSPFSDNREQLIHMFMIHPYLPHVDIKKGGHRLREQHAMLVWSPVKWRDVSSVVRHVRDAWITGECCGVFKAVFAQVAQTCTSSHPQNKLRVSAD